MKLPPEIEFHEDIRLLVYRPKGLINEAEINRVIGVIEAIEASIHRRQAHVGRVPEKSAILATDAAIVHYARLLALLTEGSSIKVRVFHDRKEAAEWLSVPLELLAP